MSCFGWAEALVVDDVHDLKCCSSHLNDSHTSWPVYYLVYFQFTVPSSLMTSTLVNPSPLAPADRNKLFCHVRNLLQHCPSRQRFWNKREFIPTPCIWLWLFCDVTLTKGLSEPYLGSSVVQAGRNTRVSTWSQHRGTLQRLVLSGTVCAFLKWPPRKH